MWLVSLQFRDAVEVAQAAGVVPPEGFEAAQLQARSGSSSRVLTIAGSEAEILIQGVITNTPDFFAMMFGGGNPTYPEIISALAEADRNPDVERITLKIDSPGGDLAGLFDTMAAIKSIGKPTRAFVSNMALSAAYGLAVHTNEIVAGNKATFFGSVGIVVQAFVSDDEVKIASTKAPKKAKDLKTEEGRAILREELDAVHDVFVASVAEGRGTTIENVNARFGQGANILAEEALKRGMIDSLAGEISQTETSPVPEQPIQEAKQMDRAEFKAAHPQLYAKAVEEGVAQERDRVIAHMTNGMGCGAMDIAAKAITDGEDMTQTLRAQYDMAGRNREELDDRKDEDAGAAPADGADPGTELNAGDLGDQVLKKLEADANFNGGV